MTATTSNSKLDQRMVWIRQLEDLAAGSPYHLLEVELASEVLIPGLLAYEQDAIRMRAITFEPDGFGLYKYSLRLRQPDAADRADAQPAAGVKGGYVLPGGPVGELAALMSLCVEARFFILSVSMRNRDGTEGDLIHKTEYPQQRGNHGPTIDRVIFNAGIERRLSDLEPFLDKVRLVAPKHHLSFMVAANRYARALRTIGIDEEMVFVRLVSAVEKMMGKHGPDRLSEKLLNVPDLTEAERAELKTTLQARRSKARFVQFLMDYSSGFFDNEPRDPEHTQVTPANLGEVASAIYRARSGYLHGGDPMFLSRVFPDTSWHFTPSVGMTWQNREFTLKERLPCADFFHRLVRYCLLAKLEELVSSAQSDGHPGSKCSLPG